MLEFMPCRAAHALYITPLSVQAEEHKAMVSEFGQSLIERSMGLSAFHRSRCIGMAGICQIWPGRAEAWIMLGEGAGAFARQIVRKARFVLDNYPCNRIEIAVKTSNAEGHKIAKLLGFGEPEGVLRAFHPDGSDMAMYARIRQWPQH